MMTEKKDTFFNREKPVEEKKPLVKTKKKEEKKKVEVKEKKKKSLTLTPEEMLKAQHARLRKVRK